MSALPYPRNAMPIVRARAAKMKPGGPILVVLTDLYETVAGDAHVFADAGTAYRWDWLRGLESVVVLVDASTKLGSLLADIEAAGAGQIDVIDVERKLGWMVCFAEPLTTTTWPRAWVIDWLGDGSLIESIHAASETGRRILQESGR